MVFKIGDKVYIPKLNRVETITMFADNLILVGEHSHNNTLYSEVFDETDLMSISDYRNKIINELLN